MKFLRPTAHVVSMIAPIVFVVSVAAQPRQTPQLQPSSQQQTARAQQQPADNMRGSDQSPLSVKILPATQTPEETKRIQDDRDRESFIKVATIVLAVLTFFIGVGQLIVYGIQAKRLRETIVTMQEISKEQKADMVKSLTESSRSAGAMESVAQSLDESVKGLSISIGISREIADRQKLIMEVASRAYIVVTFGSVTDQNIEIGLRFAATALIVNRGNTPARKVRLQVRADILPFPLPANHVFADFGLVPAGGSEIGPSLHKTTTSAVPRLYPEIEAAQIRLISGQAMYLWGVVTYEDIFSSEHFTKFAFFVFGSGEKWQSTDTNQHNESN